MFIGTPRLIIAPQISTVCVLVDGQLGELLTLVTFGG